MLDLVYRIPPGKRPNQDHQNVLLEWDPRVDPPWVLLRHPQTQMGLEENQPEGQIDPQEWTVRTFRSTESDTRTVLNESWTQKKDLSNAEWYYQDDDVARPPEVRKSILKYQAKRQPRGLNGPRWEIPHQETVQKCVIQHSMQQSVLKYRELHAT